MESLNIFWETWLDVVGYEGYYQINGIGDVMNKKTGRILKPCKNKRGYFVVQLRKNGYAKTIKVHRLVYEAFYGEIPFEMEIDHIDGNRQNNSVDNLRCVTHKENINNPITKKRQTEVNRKKAKDQNWIKKHAEAMVTFNKKTKSKPVNQFTLDRQFIKEWTSTREAARELGFNQGYISRCCLGKYKKAYGCLWEYAS